MRRVTGYLGGDLIIMHVKHAGIRIFNAETKQIKDHNNEHYNGEIDNIKITQNGKFVLFGFPNASKVFMNKLDFKTLKLQPVDNGIIEMEYDSFETDDNMTVIVFNCNINAVFPVPTGPPMPTVKHRSAKSLFLYVAILLFKKLPASGIGSWECGLSPSYACSFFPVAGSSYHTMPSSSSSSSVAVFIRLGFGFISLFPSSSKVVLRSRRRPSPPVFFGVRLLQQPRERYS